MDRPAAKHSWIVVDPEIPVQRHLHRRRIGILTYNYHVRTPPVLARRDGQRADVVAEHGRDALELQLTGHVTQQEKEPDHCRDQNPALLDE